MQKKSGFACFLREIMVLLQASYDKLYMQASCDKLYMQASYDKLYMQASYICRQAIYADKQ